jgi:ferritin-like metal-binding protein YciE
MKENTSHAIGTLHNLLDYDVAKFSSAEVQLKNILPVWKNISSSLKLKDILIRYQGYIEQHIERMEKFMREEGLSSVYITNNIMKAFIEEVQEKLGICADADVKDACLLACVQEINHYKISVYGTAAAFTKALTMDKAAVVFHEAEVNEKQIDDRLSQLAEFEINAKARAPILITS